MAQVLDFTYRNVCSYGNKMQKIPFGTDPKLILITGLNGAGKTTIANALEFSWYGRTRRRKLSGLANRHNGHLETYNKFVADDGRIVEIARGISPDYLDLKIDGKPENKAGKPKTDEFIETELLDMPFEVCTNTMILSINDFKSFVKIKADDKRKIVDRIFSLDVLNRMNVLLKEDMKAAREKLADIDSRIARNGEIITQSEIQLGVLKENLSTEAETTKVNLETMIAKIDAEIQSLTDKISTLQNEIAQLGVAFVSDTEKLRVEYDKLSADAKLELSEAELKRSLVYNDETLKNSADQQSELDALGATYNKTIEELTTDISATTTRLKTSRDVKMTAVEEKCTAAIAAADAEYQKTYDATMERNRIERLSITDKYTTIIKEVSIEQESLNTEWNECERLIEAEKMKIVSLCVKNDELTLKLALYEKNICPECESDLTTHTHESRKAEFENTVEQNKLDITASEKLLKEYGENRLRLSQRSTALESKRADAINERTKSMFDVDAAANSANSVAEQKKSTTKLEISEKRNEERADIETEYSKACDTELSGKTDALLNTKHEYELKESQIISQYDARATEYSHALNRDIAELKLKMNAERDAKLGVVSQKVSELKDAYNAAVAVKKQDSAVLSTVLEAETAKATLYRSDLAAVTEKLNDNASVKSLELYVESTKNAMITLMAEQVEADNQVKLCLATQELLTENGIKKTFMTMLMPAMNATIKRITDELQYPFHFSFDDNFDAIIEHMGAEVAPDSLSTGEEKMIDIIVVLSVMELIKMKHPKVNVMFLDEIFASLDQDNIEGVVKILREFITKYNITLFVMSHTMMPKAYFDNMINVTKDELFSDFVIS